MTLERTMYVIRRSDGKFYWKGNTSSVYDYKEGFENAYLFKTVNGARQRLFTRGEKFSAEFLPVKVTLNVDGEDNGS